MPAPSSSWAAPDRAVRIVEYNVQWNQAGVEKVAATIKQAHPDIVLLSEVPPRDVEAMARQVGLADSGLNVYVTPNNPGDWSLPSTAILSRFPITNARPIPNPGGRDFGVMGEITVDRARFCVAAVHLTAPRKASFQELSSSDKQRAIELGALMSEWQSRGNPPLIVGGDFNQIEFGWNYDAMTKSFTDALARLNHKDWTCQHGVLRTRIDYLLLSKEWHAKDGAVIEASTSDHRPIWIDAISQKNSK